MANNVGSYETGLDLHCLQKYLCWSAGLKGLDNTQAILSGCFTVEPVHVKTYKMACAPAKTQISLGIRPVRSVFAVLMKKA